MSIHQLHMKLYIAQEGRCFQCNKPMNPWPDRVDLKQGAYRKNGWTRDHLVPQWLLKAKLWTLKYNIVLAHSKCNKEKAGRFPTKEEVIKFVSIYKKVLKLD